MFASWLFPRVTLVALALLLGCQTVDPPDVDDTDDPVADTADTDVDTDDTDVSPIQTLIHEVVAPVEIRTVDSSYASDGSLYVVWSEMGTTRTQVWAARSTDGGVTFSAPGQVNIGDVLISTWGQSRAKIAASTDQVAVTFTDHHGTDIWVSVADANDSLEFAAPTALAAEGEEAVNNFPVVAYTPDGELWVAWSMLEGLPGEERLRVFAARESGGLVAEAITDESLGRPCTCCGMDMLALSSGEVVIAYRGMVSPRNQYVVRHPGGAGGSWTSVKASTTNWEFTGCPENGPALAEGPDGSVSQAWSDSSAGQARVWMVDSSDKGLSWGGQRRILESYEGGQVGALLAIEASGRTWAGWYCCGSSPQILSSEDGQTFSEPASLEIPEGALKQPQLFADSGGAFAVGVVDGTQLWMSSLSNGD